VGARRDDITNVERAQITLAVLNPERSRGTVTNLGEAYNISRQTVYEIAAKGEQVLLAGLSPGPHGPQAAEQVLVVNRNRLARGTAVLTGEGVSQRGVRRCLAEMLDTEVSLGWINGEVARAEQAAEEVNAHWHPAVEETLSGDELYSNGAANLLVVGNDSLYIYALLRPEACDGDTWGCILLDSPDAPQFASDGGTSLAAGAQAAGIAVHQLDWDHLLRPLWGQVTRLEKQAYAALAAVEERAAKFNQTHTPKRLAQHLVAWERLSADAEEKMARYDAFWQLAEHVDAQFGLIDLETGQVRDPVSGAATLCKLGAELQAWKGRIYAKLGTQLVNWSVALFHYQPVLRQQLAPLIERWGAPAIQALSRIWQIEADQQRHAQPLLEQQARQGLWEASLDAAHALLGGKQLWQAWAALSQVLDRVWRGSMLAECVNSLLRPKLDRRKHTDQGCLELFRFLHNVQPFERGKRAGHSPAELVGLAVPDDFLTLLGYAPKTQARPEKGMIVYQPVLPAVIETVLPFKIALPCYSRIN
jgi:hypothetical protein